MHTSKTRHVFNSADCSLFAELNKYIRHLKKLNKKKPIGSTTVHDIINYSLKRHEAIFFILLVRFYLKFYLIVPLMTSFIPAFNHT